MSLAARCYRFGAKREPGCQCEYNFTCRVCLMAAAHRAQAERVGAKVPS